MVSVLSENRIASVPSEFLKRACAKHHKASESIRSEPCTFNVRKMASTAEERTALSRASGLLSETELHDLRHCWREQPRGHPTLICCSSLNRRVDFNLFGKEVKLCTCKDKPYPKKRSLPICPTTPAISYLTPVFRSPPRPY
eukprot:3676907-Amphidinium_carterae.1